MTAERLERLVARFRKLGAFYEEKSLSPLGDTVPTPGTVAIQCADELAAALAAEGPGSASPAAPKLEFTEDQIRYAMRDLPNYFASERWSGPMVITEMTKRMNEALHLNVMLVAAPSLHKEGLPAASTNSFRVGRHAGAEMHLAASVFCQECRMLVEVGTDDCPHATALHKEGAGGVPAQRELKLKEVLSKHWLTGIHCHHAISPDDSTYDWAACACSKVNLPHRGTVGEAVRTWIEHVLDELAAAPAGRAEPPQTCSNCGGKTWFTDNGLCGRCSPNVNAAKDASPSRS